MWLLGILCSFLTAPYHGSLLQYTLTPLKQLAGEKNVTCFQRSLQNWRGAKEHELKVVQVSSGLLAAAVVSVFSWPDVPHTYWLARGLWYWSLSLAAFAFLIAGQQNSVLGTFKDVTTKEEMELAKEKIGRISKSGSRSLPHYAVLYFWQCPAMHMSYSWITFFLGLLVHVCRPIVPLIRNRVWTDDTDVMIFFLIAFGAGVINFSVCSVISRAKNMRHCHINAVLGIATRENNIEDLESGKAEHLKERPHSV